MTYGKMIAPTERTKKTLKSGVVVEHTTRHYQKCDLEEFYYYYQGKEMAVMSVDPETRSLYFNRKYLKDPELKAIRSLIRRRAKPKAVSEYFNL